MTFSKNMPKPAILLKFQAKGCKQVTIYQHF